MILVAEDLLKLIPKLNDTKESCSPHMGISMMEYG